MFRFGHAGVDFFFVLSGFIITYVHHRDLGNPARFVRYARNRIRRIYPPYWVVTFLLIAVAIVSRHRERLAPLHLLASFALIPHGQPPLVGVAWTLQHEMLFYVCFGLAVLWRPLGGILLAACLGLVAAGLLLPEKAWWWVFLTSPFHLQFIMGIAAARWVMCRRIPLPRLLAGGGGLAFLLAGLAENADWIGYLGFESKLGFGLASLVLVVGLAGAERQGLLRVGSFGALIGGASYAIYLLHDTVTNSTAYLLARTGLIRFFPVSLLLVVLCAVTVAVAITFFLTIEQPIMRALTTMPAFRKRAPAGAAD
jgi:exopolysaccharide production protein ExoZ